MRLIPFSKITASGSKCFIAKTAVLTKFFNCASDRIRALICFHNYIDIASRCVIKSLLNNISSIAIYNQPAFRKFYSKIVWIVSIENEIIIAKSLCKCRMANYEKGHTKHHEFFVREI